MKNKLFIITYMCLVIVYVSAVGQKKYEELNIGVLHDFSTLHPFSLITAAMRYIYGFTLRNSLVYINENNEWKNTEILVKIPTLENGFARFVTEKGVKKIKSYWEINPNAKWADGTNITSDDFIFTYELFKLINPNYSDIEKIESYKKDLKKFVITHKTLGWDFFAAFSMVLPKHLEFNAYKKALSKKAEYIPESTYNKNLYNLGLWVGPYVISNIDAKKNVTLEQNKYWWGKKPAFKKIYLKYYSTSVAIEKALLSGEIDMINRLAFELDQTIEFENKINKEKLPFNIIYQPGAYYEHIKLNLLNPILSDIKVRKALIHSINREEINKVLFYNKQKLAYSFLFPWDPRFTEDNTYIVKYEYSPDKAKKLLTEAGWKVGNDGIRTKQNMRLSLKYTTTSGNKIRENVQALFVEQAYNVGIELIPDNKPISQMTAELSKKKFDLMMFSTTQLPGMSLLNSHHSQAIPSEKNNWIGENFSSWSNSIVDKLIEAEQLEFNQENRILLGRQILKYYTSELPDLALYYKTLSIIYPKNITNIKVPLYGFPESYQIENWAIK